MSLPTVLFDVVRFLPLLAVVGYAAKLDLTVTVEGRDEDGAVYTCGAVPNRVWLYFFVGASLTLLDLIFSFSVGLLLMDALSFGFALFFGFLLYALRGWGGADAKAFIVIGASAPLFPRWGLMYSLPFPFGMLPFLVLFVSCAGAVGYSKLKPSKVPFKKRKVRFLPYMFAGLIVATIL